MHKTGLYLLYTWLIFNCILALGITAGMTFFHINAPGIRILLSVAEISALDPRYLATMNALALLANGIIAAFCGLILYLLHESRARKQFRIFQACAVALCFVQILGFMSDSYLGNANLWMNILSSLILLLGLVLYWLPAWKKSQNKKME